MENSRASSSHQGNDSPYARTTSSNLTGYPVSQGKYAPTGYPPTVYPGQQPPVVAHQVYPAPASSTVSQQPAVAEYTPLANAAQHQLPVNNKPVVVLDSKFLTPSVVDLVVSRKLSFLEGTFGVTDLQGNILFKVKGKMFSLHDKRVLLDSQDKPIVSFQQKILTAHRRWNAFRGESSDSKDLIFTVKKSSILQFGSSLDVFLAGNNSKDQPNFKIKGSYSESSCTIYAADGTTVLCQMRRQQNSAGSLLFGMDKFGVTVYPNVDVAFIVALVVILEEINQDRNGQD